jgi:hypothetical protein
MGSISSCASTKLSIAESLIVTQPSQNISAATILGQHSLRNGMMLKLARQNPA